MRAINLFYWTWPRRSGLRGTAQAAHPGCGSLRRPSSFHAQQDAGSRGWTRVFEARPYRRVRRCRSRKGLLFFRAELAGWFGGFGRYSGSGADRAFWIEAYGGRQFTIDRVKHPQPIVIPHLSIAVLGGTQPDRLLDLLHSPDDGLQARFLWLWPDKVPPRRPTRCPNAAAALEAFRRLAELRLVLGGAGDERPRPLICPLEDDAAALFDQWRCEHAAIEVFGALASAYGKAPGHLLRLAVVLEHLWWADSAGYAAPPSRISLQAVHAAAALIEDYF
jgi:uncharacterized protein DUF3987